MLRASVIRTVETGLIMDEWCGPYPLVDCDCAGLKRSAKFVNAAAVPPPVVEETNSVSTALAWIAAHRKERGTGRVYWCIHFRGRHVLVPP